MGVGAESWPLKARGRLGILQIQWLGLDAFTAKGQVQHLLRELRSQEPHGGWVGGGVQGGIYLKAKELARGTEVS